MKPSTFLPAAEIQQIPAVRLLQVSRHHRLCFVSLYQQLNWSDTHGFPPWSVQQSSPHLPFYWHPGSLWKTPCLSLSRINLCNVDLFRCATKRGFLHTVTAGCFWCCLLSQERQKGPGSKSVFWDAAERSASIPPVVMHRLPRITSTSAKD